MERVYSRAFLADLAWIGMVARRCERSWKRRTFCKYRVAAMSIPIQATSYPRSYISQRSWNLAHCVLSDAAYSLRTAIAAFTTYVLYTHVYRSLQDCYPSLSHSYSCSRFYSRLKHAAPFFRELFETPTVTQGARNQGLRERVGGTLEASVTHFGVW